MVNERVGGGARSQLSERERERVKGKLGSPPSPNRLRKSGTRQSCSDVHEGA